MDSVPPPAIQIVLSGTKKAMDLACELSKSKGIKRCVPLNVSCPFHSAILAPAKDPLQRALDAVTLAKPSVPLVSNVTAQPVCTLGLTPRPSPMSRNHGTV